MAVFACLLSQDVQACGSSCCDDTEITEAQSSHCEMDAEEDACSNSCDDDCGGECDCDCCEGATAVSATISEVQLSITSHEFSYLSPYIPSYSFEYAGAIWQPPKI